MENVISVKNLCREYISTQGIIKREKKIIKALDNISFDIRKGEIFGLLGQNGAGKTTTIKILITLLAPTSGQAKVLGYNTFGQEKNIRSRINFIFGGERCLYWRLSARDNLTYFADLYKIEKKVRDKRIKDILELVGLTERADDKVETYSKGMKQKLQIARGLINDPEILFLDEPTIGLDPISALELRKLIKMLSSQGKTILLTTHYMYEADELCDRIAIINKGSIISLDTPKNLKKFNKDTSVLEVKTLGVSDEIIKQLKELEDIKMLSVKQEDQTQILEIQCSDVSCITQKVLNILSNTKVIGINSRESTLEDVYIKLIGGTNIG
jgi:ABC-2 type transport system ATP-binding protein